ncbi:hypothetical protein O9993_03175 [Vibrio lentus]|nr:hypothetical protein [Vibrio lentus]
MGCGNRGGFIVAIWGLYLPNILIALRRVGNGIAVTWEPSRLVI